MAFYYYQAFSKDGKKVTGQMEALNQQQVRTNLSLKGLYPVTVVLKKTSNENDNFFIRLFTPKMSLKDKIFFTKQLSLLLKSGIPLNDSLSLMLEQVPSYMIMMINKMRSQLSEGISFANILELYPSSFPPLYIQLVRAGEASGQMEKVLNRLADFLEEQDTFNKAVKGAVRGPLLQIGLVFVIAGFLLTFIVPKITEVFMSMGGKKLPGLTLAVMAVSDALINNYIIISLVALIIFSLYYSWKITVSGKYTLDVIKLKLPLISYFTKMKAIIEFSQTLGLLLESGVNITEALDIVVQITENQILVTALKKARDNIIKQGRVGEYLQKTNLFSSVAIHLISTGEQSGALDVMLNQVGKHAQDELTEFSTGLTSLLNPLSMLLMALVVGTIIIAIMGPLTQMSSMAG